MVTAKGLAVLKNRDKSGYEPEMPRNRLKRITSAIMDSHSLGRSMSAMVDSVGRARGAWKDTLSQLKDGMMRLVKSSRSRDAPFSIFSMKGNEKLPFASFSALPEHTCPGAGECLDWCYSFTAWRYPAAWARQVQNTLLLKYRPHVVAHAFRQLPEGIVVRLYVDGDFDSEQTIKFWFELLRERPDIQAYGYSKSWELIAGIPTELFPANYRLNLSSGGKEQSASVTDMMNLPITRGEFIAVPVKYRPAGKQGNVGFERYDDPEYHRAVRDAAAKMGLGKVFSCPGKCGECAGGRHACGSPLFKGVKIAIGVH